MDDAPDFVALPPPPAPGIDDRPQLLRVHGPSYENWSATRQALFFIFYQPNPSYLCNCHKKILNLFIFPSWTIPHCPFSTWPTVCFARHKYQSVSWREIINRCRRKKNHLYLPIYREITCGMAKSKLKFINSSKIQFQPNSALWKLCFEQERPYYLLISGEKHWSVIDLLLRWKMPARLSNGRKDSSSQVRPVKEGTFDKNWY